jgi:hypothetical protein
VGWPSARWLGSYSRNIHGVDLVFFVLPVLLVVPEPSRRRMLEPCDRTRVIFIFVSFRFVGDDQD